MLDGKVKHIGQASLYVFNKTENLSVNSLAKNNNNNNNNYNISWNKRLYF